MFSFLEMKQNQNRLRDKSQQIQPIINHGFRPYFPKGMKRIERVNQTRLLKRNSPLGNFQSLDSFTVIPGVLRGGI